MAEPRAALGPRAPGERHGAKERRAPAGRHEAAEELVVVRDPREAPRATVSAVAVVAAPRMLGVRVLAAPQAVLVALAAQRALTWRVAASRRPSRRHFRIVAHAEAPRVVATARVARLAGDEAATRQVAPTPVEALDRVAAMRRQVTVAEAPGRMPVVAPQATGVRRREAARRRVAVVPRPPAARAPAATAATAAPVATLARVVMRAAAGTRRLVVRRVAVPAPAAPVGPRDHADRRHLEARAHPE